jgi:hypothetical protein
MAIVDDVFERRKKFLDYILYTLTILPATFLFWQNIPSCRRSEKRPKICSSNFFTDVR